MSQTTLGVDFDSLSYDEDYSTQNQNTLVRGESSCGMPSSRDSTFSHASSRSSRYSNRDSALSHTSSRTSGYYSERSSTMSSSVSGRSGGQRGSDYMAPLDEVSDDDLVGNVIAVSYTHLTLPTIYSV